MFFLYIKNTIIKNSEEDSEKKYVKSLWRRGSVHGKANTFPNLKKYEPDIDKI